MEKLSYRSLPRKVRWLALLLITLPFITVGFLRQFETVLVENLLQNLAEVSAITASMLSSSDYLETLSKNNQQALSLDSEDLKEKNSISVKDSQSPPIYVIEAPSGITIDGFADDWQSIRGFAHRFTSYNSNDSGESKTPSDSITIEYSVTAASDAQYFYLLIKVIDSDVRYRESLSEFSANDQVFLRLKNPSGEQVKIYFAPVAVGKLSPIIDNQISNSFWISEAFWQEDSNGYTLEVKIPKRTEWTAVGIEVFDYQADLSEVVSLSTYQKLLNELIWSDETLSALLDELPIKEGRRFWIIDNQGRVKARRGELVENLDSGILNPIIHWLLARSDDFSDPRAQATKFDSELIKNALAGSTGTQLEASNQQQQAIAIAASPIEAKGQRVGAIVVEQTVAAVQVLQKQAMSVFINTTFFLMLGVIVLLILLALGFSSRILRLRDLVRSSVDTNGRVVKSVPIVKVKDELSELQSSFAAMNRRLQDYSEYLEKLASRLTHEIRTPVAAIRSSIDNLVNTASDEQQTSLKHAQQGVERLSEILVRMREATRLEQSVIDVPLERVDLSIIVRDYIEAIRPTFRDHQLTLCVEGKAVGQLAAPELITQMLDKLLSNAQDFAPQDTAIECHLKYQASHLAILVANQGSALPDIDAQELFGLMTSSRSSEQRKSQSHLGLGLYIVRLIAEHHYGRYFARNWLVNDQKKGVMVGVELPLIEVSKT